MTQPGTAPAGAGGEAGQRPLIEVANLSKSFGATQALSSASLALRPGTVHVLLGENGAGKSTLAKIIAGVHRPDSGSIAIDGNPVRIASVADAIHHGIGMVFQELSLVPHLSCRANLFLGQEKAAHPLTFVAARRERERARALFRQLELDIDLETPVRALPIAHKQLVEIAKVLARRPRVLIMDEPTSSLTEGEKAVLFRTIRSLKQAGVAIIYVTHHLREIMEIGDWVSTMSDGVVTGTFPVTPDLTEQKLLAMLTGREVQAPAHRGAAVAGPVLLAAEGIQTRTGCRDVGLTVRRGEIVGIYGVVGCGRESLGRVLIGLEPPRSGTLTLEGRRYRPRHPPDARRQGIAYLAFDRKQNGILPNRSIRENLNLTRVGSFRTAQLFVAERREKTATVHLLRDLSVKYADPELTVTTLSGGNQQKVLFGRAVSTRPKLIVMEDPTAGIDMGAKGDLHRMIRRLAGEGVSFLIFSSDLTESLTLCDRLYTMYAGSIVDEIAAPDFSHEERVLEGVLGTRHGRARGDELKVPA